MNQGDFKMSPEMTTAIQEMKKRGMEMMALTDLKRFSYLNHKASAGGILFLGDSITHNFPAYEMVRGKDVFVRGISGITAQFMEEHMKEFAEGLKPEKVFLLIGINSIGDGEPVEVTAGRIKKICDWLKEHMPSTEIYLEDVYPINGSTPIYRQTIGARSNEEVRALNEHLHTIAGVQHIDLYEALADAEGNLREELTDDGLHPNMEGYEIVMEGLRSFL